MNDQSRNRSVVAAHSLSSDARLRWDLSLRLQFWRCRRLKPKPLLRPRRPRRRPQMRRSLARSADRNGDPGERNGVRNDARDAQSGVRSGAQDATSDETPATAPPPPSKKSNRSNYGNHAALSACRRKVLRHARQRPAIGTGRAARRAPLMSFSDAARSSGASAAFPKGPDTTGQRPYNH